MVSEATGSIKEDGGETLKRNTSRFYKIGGITIQVDSDLPFSETTFSNKFDIFRVVDPGLDLVKIHHHFTLPHIPVEERGVEIFRRRPWAIYRKGTSWLYAGIPPDGTDWPLHKMAVFSDDHASGDIYHTGPGIFLRGDLTSLTTFPTDQILIARLLADRNGCYLHSAGAVMDGKGLLFVGHSEAGKTTTSRLLSSYAEILCDDRNIVRRTKEGWQVYGSWSHGDLASVSAISANLYGILFLEKADINRITEISDGKDKARRLLATVIRPFVTADWWEKTLSIVEQLVREVPCYRMEFDMTGAIIEELRRL